MTIEISKLRGHELRIGYRVNIPKPAKLKSGQSYRSQTNRSALHMIEAGTWEVKIDPSFVGTTIRRWERRRIWLGLHGAQTRNKVVNGYPDTWARASCHMELTLDDAERVVAALVTAIAQYQQEEAAST